MPKSELSSSSLVRNPRRKVQTFALLAGSTLSSQQYTDIIRCGIRDVLEPLTEALFQRALLKLDRHFQDSFQNTHNFFNRTKFRMLVQSLTMPGSAAKNRVIELLKEANLPAATDRLGKNGFQKQVANVWPGRFNGIQVCVECGEQIASGQTFLKKQDNIEKMRLIRIQSEIFDAIPLKKEEFIPIHFYCWFGNLLWDEMKEYRSARTHLIKQTKCARSFLKASYTLKTRLITTQKDLRSIHTEWLTNWRLSTDIKKDSTWSYEKEILAYSNVAIMHALNGDLTTESLEYLFGKFLDKPEIEEVLTNFRELKRNSIENITSSRIVLLISKNTRDLVSLNDLPQGTLQICTTHPLKENEIKRLTKLGFSVKNLEEGGFVVSRQSVDVASFEGNSK